MKKQKKNKQKQLIVSYIQHLVTDVADVIPDNTQKENKWSGLLFVNFDFSPPPQFCQENSVTFEWPNHKVSK